MKMACLKLHSKWAVEECISTFQQHSMTKFVHYNSSKSFNSVWKPSPSCQVYWEWNKPDIETASIPFDKIPFMFIGHRYMACHQGADSSKKKKYRSYDNQNQESSVAEGSVLYQNKTRTQGSKKVGCPALMRITRIAKFPQYKLTDKITLCKKREKSKSLKEQLLWNPSSVYWNEVFYLILPCSGDHFGHPVANGVTTLNAPTMDKRIKEKIIEFTHHGVRNVRQMRSLLRKYVDEYLTNESTCIDAFPSHIAIRCVMRYAQELCSYTLVQNSLALIPLDNDELKVREFKRKCIDRLKSMMQMVDVVKSSRNLNYLPNVIGDALASNLQSFSKLNHTSFFDRKTSCNKAGTRSSFQTDKYSSALNPYKPIKVIIESYNVETSFDYDVPPPPSIVEIAINDDYM